MIRNLNRIVIGAALLLFVGAVLPAVAQDPLVQIYLVRHPETDPAPSDTKAIHLSAVGHQRAALLVPTLAGVKISHVFASHTIRARQTLEHIARERSLPIVQLPVPGSVVKGQVVTDELSRREAIEPIAEALLSLPSGSTAVVALNSENIFAVLNRLGVPVADAGTTCAIGQRCVPCLNNTCFPRDAFDRVWYIALRPGERFPLAFTELRYGAGWSPTNTR